MHAYIFSYRDLIEMYDWIVMPLVNPDGYEYSHTEVTHQISMQNMFWRKKNSVIFIQDRMWRKNRGESKTILNLLSNCKGIDLNRNFAYSWGELDILRWRKENCLGSGIYQLFNVSNFQLSRRNTSSLSRDFHRWLCLFRGQYDIEKKTKLDIYGPYVFFHLIHFLFRLRARL